METIVRLVIENVQVVEKLTMLETIAVYETLNATFVAKRDILKLFAFQERKYKSTLSQKMETN